jgi:hypothetical protein
MRLTSRLIVFAMCGGVGFGSVLGGSARTAAAGDRCVYQGMPYSDGAASCQGGVLYKCDDGEWKSKRERCSRDRIVEERDTVVAPPAEGRIIEKRSETQRID